MSTKKASGGLKYYSEESTGLKISPKTVLIMSLVYIGIVVLLHIYAKLGSSSPAKADASNDSSRPNPASS
jgi:protein transport protein SEC61 subunit beta